MNKKIVYGIVATLAAIICTVVIVLIICSMGDDGIDRTRNPNENDAEYGARIATAEKVKKDADAAAAQAKKDAEALAEKQRKEAEEGENEAKKQTAGSGAAASSRTPEPRESFTGDITPM